jgi:large subunit ribosomal protein L3
MAFIVGRKIGMTQTFTADGKRIPVTIVQAKPGKVLSVKTTDKDGYNAAVAGFEEIEGAKINAKAQLGYFKKLGSACYKIVKECRDLDAEAGADLTVEQFTAGDVLRVSGLSKGKGWTGTIKLWNFSRGRGSHGGKFIRHPGSIGNCTEPARVPKGRKMAGVWGSDKISLRSSTVVAVDKEDDLLLVKGPLPGGKNGLLMVEKLSGASAEAEKKSA